MSAKNPVELTLEVIDEYLLYDPDLGLLYWKKVYGTRGKRRKPGDLAGSPRGNGYWQVGLCGNVCHAHRIAWALAYRVWPILHGIDHINGNRSDNRLCNLRAATQAQNMWNRGAPRNSTTGVRGVRQFKNGRYWATIGYHYETIYLGCFATLEDARAAYDDAAKRLYGEFYSR